VQVRALLRYAGLLLAFAAPANAGTVYLPVLDENGTGGVQRLTDLVIANTGSIFGEYEVSTLALDSDGTVRTGTPVAGALHRGVATRLDSIGAGGSTVLLEIAADPGIAIEARLRTVSQDRTRTTESVVPVVSSDNALTAGATAKLLGLYRDATVGDASDLALLNLETESGACTIKTFLADGTQVGVTSAVVVKPLSLRIFSDALALLGLDTVNNGRMDISCDTAFYAFAALTRRDRAETEWIMPAASGASTLTRPGDAPPPPPPSGGLVFRADGLIHTATPASPKRVIKVPVDRELRLRRLVVDMDFTPGPWNTSKNPNNHAIFWLHRGKFRGNTIGNVNAFGPSKFTIKAAQNINMAARTQTDSEQGVPLVQGTRYHVTYTYNAEAGSVTCVVTANGSAVLTLGFSAASAGGALTVPTSGLNIEFGHNAGQEGPEVPSHGWTYSNLRIEMVPF
jgi:hypothetical protein